MLCHSFFTITPSHSLPSHSRSVFCNYDDMLCHSFFTITPSHSLPSHSHFFTDLNKKDNHHKVPTCVISTVLTNSPQNPTTQKKPKKPNPAPLFQKSSTNSFYGDFSFWWAVFGFFGFFWLFLFSSFSLLVLTLFSTIYYSIYSLSPLKKNNNNK